MLPRRKISEIIQWRQHCCNCTVTHGIPQGLLQLPLVCEAPAGTAEASLNAYRCCAKPSSLGPVTAELFTAGTVFLQPELNFSAFCCWWWWWVCCVVLSHLEPIFVCVFFLDKTSKKKKVANLRGSPVNKGSITCQEGNQSNYFLNKYHTACQHSILHCLSGLWKITFHPNIEIFPGSKNDCTTGYAEPSKAWFAMRINLIFFSKTVFLLIFLKSVNKFSFLTDWMIRWQWKFYVHEWKIIH